MKLRYILLPAILLAAGLGFAASQKGGNARADAIFKRADLNSDGKVTRDELPDGGTFARFDVDGDGTITLEEGRKVLNRMADAGAPAGSEAAPGETSPPERIFDYLDKNKDGALSDDELPQQAKRLKALDQDKDGRITRTEAIEGIRRYQEKNGIIPTSPTSPGAGEPAKPIVIGPDAIKGGDVGVGRQLADFSFTTLDGRTQRLSELAGTRGVVIAYTSTTCPVSRRYMPSLSRLQTELGEKGVALLLVNPFASEKAEEIKADIARHQITAPYVHDTDKFVTASLHARTTTEVFLVDGTRTLLYRGALDDQYGLTYNLEAPRQQYLADAVDAMLSGSLPHVAATNAPGCELDVPAAATVASAGAVTYHRDVARILEQNCVQCHREGGIAPFALDELAEVQDRAKTIKRVVENGQMPPWFAAPAPEGTESPWANDCSLGARDKADLLAWINSSDRPLGDPKDAPAKLRFATEWNIGKPDLIVQIPKPIAVKAEGYMPYQLAVAETTLTEDKWVSAYEVQPTERSVVHHVIIQVHEKGAKVRDQSEGGVSGFFAAYVPGNGQRIYPEGFARKLPAGSKLSFQIHYTPSGKAVEEQVRIGLVFAKHPPQYEVKTLAISDRDLNIPPGDPSHVESIERAAPFDVNALAFVPHMHVRGKAFRYEATMPDGQKKVLLDIPRYDFNWQIRYEFKQPLLLPRGSRVKVTATYDNSTANKANPDPTKLVHWGQQTYDEMMIGYIEYFLPLNSGVASR